jgi:hypothetical protein
MRAPPALAQCALLAAAACASGASGPPPAQAPTATSAPAEAARPAEISYEPEWHKTSFGWYLAPQHDLGNDGAVDLVVHFHFGHEADTAWRSSHLDAVIVSATFGMGSGAYEHAMRDPARLDKMIDEVLRALAEERKSGPLHVRRLGLVSFSAGFGAVGQVLASSPHFDRVDTVVLLDSFHTSYLRGRKPDPRPIAAYIRFAEGAKEGKKLMVVTHSSIAPADYPSSTETTATLLEAVGVAKQPAVETNARGMRQIYRADAGALHAFGFEGEMPKDHMQHLAIVGDLVREYVVPRWAK